MKTNKNLKGNNRLYATNNKGITLVALIITIIIMLILVGVSVQVVISSDLLGQSEKAGNAYKSAYEEEQIRLAIISGFLAGKGEMDYVVLNKELRTIGYEGREISILPATIRINGNTYTIYDTEVERIQVANKFNIDTIIKNSYVNATGEERPVDGYNMTDYIYVFGHNLLLLGGDGVELQSKRNIGAYALYDKEKNFISRVSEIYGTGYKIPSNVYYIRVQYLNNGKVIMADGKYHDVNQINLDNWSEYDVYTEVKNYNLNNLVTYGDSHVARGIWQPEVIEYFDIKNHVNLGIGSSTVAINENATQPSFIDETRISRIKEANPDTIIIIGGTNDVHLESTLGTEEELRKPISEKDQTNFYGAYSYLIETLKEWKPNLNIIICTIPQGDYDTYHPVKYSDISDAIRKISEFYSLTLVDIFDKCRNR